MKTVLTHRTPFGSIKAPRGVIEGRLQQVSEFKSFVFEQTRGNEAITSDPLEFNLLEVLYIRYCYNPQMMNLIDVLKVKNI